jgi:hypothetical protein
MILKLCFLGSFRSSLIIRVFIEDLAAVCGDTDRNRVPEQGRVFLPWIA